MRLAVNIENPADLSASAESYYPTSQSIDFVRGLASAALEGGAAHALLGPYGAGKSSLAAFALNELSYATSSFAPVSRSDLFGRDQGPVAEVLNAGGLAPMSIVGATEPLASRIVLALKALTTSDSYLGNIPALQPCATLDPREATSDQALLLLNDTARAVRKCGKAGALLIIDEFGRHLEHMLSTASDADLHLLQSIAEATGQADSPLSLVIIQHLGLEHYGSMLHGPRRYEWDKVRGRFSETVLNHSETDTAHIVAKILRNLGVRCPKESQLVQLSEASPILRDTEFLLAARDCYPLHPTTVVLLSRLSKVIGQNDRTIVGWLASDMDSGFRQTWAKHGGAWLYPDVLYDHFFGDVMLAPPNPAFAKRLAAIHTAHERIGDDLSVDARRLFRILALLFFCAGRGVRADRASAVACLPEGTVFDRCIDELTSRSLVLYRQFRSEYVVWEGSDYDVALHMAEELSGLSLDVASEMNGRNPLPVLAHGHLIRTGNRRTAQVLWLKGGDAPPESNGEPRILIWLVDRVPEDVPPTDVVGVADVRALEPHLRESAAIRRLLHQDTALQDDAIASKELETRLAFHEGRVTTMRRELLESDLGWRVGAEDHTTMQRALSAAMDLAYSKAFTLHNELINRNTVSPQVTFALRKLIGHLYADSARENLGIEKFPAERIIYESMLKQTGLHRPTSKGAWQLRLEGTPLTAGLGECVAEARRWFVHSEAHLAPSVDSVVNHLSAPPYGVKRTPGLLVCILILLDDRDAHELYEDQQFLPHWGPDTLLRMLKAPRRFTILGPSASPVNTGDMREYRNALTNRPEMAPGIAPVSLAREALHRHANLSPYAQRTGTVSRPAQAFRRALEVSKSPSDMLFRQIPQALLGSTFPSQDPARRRFLKGLAAVWRELEGADRALMARLQRAALDTLRCATVAEARSCASTFATHLLADENIRHGYESFLSYVSDDTIADDGAWLECVIAKGLGISTPLRSWSDNHASQAEFLLRRNLLALRQARDMLVEGKVQDDAAPFSVFWPNPSVPLGQTTQRVMKRMASLAQSIPASERLAVIADLARMNRSSK